MKPANRNEYQRIYQAKWRNENKIRHIQNQLNYWQKKLNECVSSQETV